METVVCASVPFPVPFPVLARCVRTQDTKTEHPRVLEYDPKFLDDSSMSQDTVRNLVECEGYVMVRCGPEERVVSRAGQWVVCGVVISCACVLVLCQSIIPFRPQRAIKAALNEQVCCHLWHVGWLLRGWGNGVFDRCRLPHVADVCDVRDHCCVGATVPTTVGGLRARLDVHDDPKPSAESHAHVAQVRC